MRFLLLTLLIMACESPTDDVVIPEEFPSVTFRFPLPDRDRFSVLVGIDHDPIDHSDEPLGDAICTAYDGRHFPHCYDQHDGSDYLLNGDVEQMDIDPSPIVAAADGVVIDTRDGFYDKCHISAGGDISCDGHPIKANYVIVQHMNGYTSRYWHMRKDSVAVQVGDQVLCGDKLGEVGSSGRSSKPHLHFEVQRPDGLVIDPYAGSFSQEETYWTEQRGTDELPGAACAAG